MPPRRDTFWRHTRLCRGGTWWHGGGKAVAGRWHSAGTALARRWHGAGTALARPGTPLTLARVSLCVRRPNAEGESKTGANIGAANIGAIERFGTPLHNIDYCCSDGTSPNSSLTIDKLKGGAYAHMWTHMREKGHVLFFYIMCLSHVGNNEVEAVCKAAGTCTRQHLLYHKGKRNVENKKSRERLRLPELLADISHAVKKTKGCVAYLRAVEDLERLGDPPGGATTRWGYWIDVAAWIMPTCERYEHIIAYLLHKWLKAQGDADGLQIDEGSVADGDAPLGGEALVAKVKELKDQARRELLLEMLDPTVRVWLCFLALYGQRSLKPFLYFTENDGAGNAFKAGRVIGSRLGVLKALMSSDEKAKDLQGRCPWKDFMAPLREMVAARSDAFKGVRVRDIVRKGAKAAYEHFESRTTAWRSHPALVALGAMDKKGHAVAAAQTLMGLAKQGAKGVSQAMLPHMPDTATAIELEGAINSATDGVGVFFQDESLAVFRRLAECGDAKARLVDVEGGRELHDFMWRVACYVPIGNFYSETVVKTLTRDLHGTQRRSEACAERLVAARHRARVHTMSQADFKWAAAILGHNLALRKQAKPGVEEELRPLDLTRLLDAIELPKPDEPEEKEPSLEELEAVAEAEEEEADADGEVAAEDEASSAGRQPGWPMDPKVKVGAIRKAVSTGSVIEVFWGLTPEQKPKIYLALVTEVKTRIVRIRWLHEVEGESDTYVRCPFYKKEESVGLREIWDPASDVVSVAAVSDEERWRRAAGEGEDDGESEGGAEEAEGRESSRVAAQDVTEEEETKPIESSSAATYRKSSWGDALRSVPEPVLHGAARQRRSSAPLPSDDDREWFNDAILAVADAVDTRPPSDAILRYMYPYAGWHGAIKCLRTRSAQRTLHACDCVLVVQFCIDRHWHSISLIGPEKLAYYWEPFGTALERRGELRMAWESLPKADGWELHSIGLELQTDGYQCGPWAHWFRSRLFAYAAREADGGRLGSRSFPSHLTGSEGITQLFGLSRVRKEATGRANTALMLEERKRLRSLLRAAAARNALPQNITSAQLDDFIEKGASHASSPAIDLDAWDEIAGDDQYFSVD